MARPQQNVACKEPWGQSVLGQKTTNPTARKVSLMDLFYGQEDRSNPKYGTGVMTAGVHMLQWASLWSVLTYVQEELYYTAKPAYENQANLEPL